MVKVLFLLLIFVIIFMVSTADLIAPTVWPQPKIFTTGESSLRFGPLKFFTEGGEISTLKEAYSRYSLIMFPHETDSKDTLLMNPKLVTVKVTDRSEAYPQIDTDESYTLDISEPIITISAKTVYGALYGLESLSQLISYDFDSRTYAIPSTPIHIEDAPRYSHRGMLLDTSRHFQPISFLQKTIDSLSYAKYNVLHWHVVDTQSFPFESSSYPRLWQGSYTKQERYSRQDIISLVEYGRMRGVKIMIEFDMPGHAASWCTGYPEICPSSTCLQPLNPASNLTFPLISGLLGECSGANDNSQGLFPYNFIHLGGDEVSYTCWEANAEIRAWEKLQGFNGSEDTYEYFVNKAANIAREVKRTPMQWVEVFEHFGSNLDKDTVVHVWKKKTTLDGVLQAGYKALLSNQDDWYLDHLSTTWQTMYQNEPTAGLSATSDPSLILGGESCMWGETVDPSDLMSTVWPRAAAVAEVLWTPYEVIYPQGSSSTIDLDAVEARLETFRCLLNQRGIAAAPVTNSVARYQPAAPGSCYMQRRY